MAAKTEKKMRTIVILAQIENSSTKRRVFHSTKSANLMNSLDREGDVFMYYILISSYNKTGFHNINLT